MIDSLYPCFFHWSWKGSVWLISDTHFDDPDTKLMDPNWISPTAHIEILSRYIKKNDTLIHLGDVGNPEYMRQLKCFKVLITGNHDKGKTYYSPYFNEIYTGPLAIAERLILSHEPIDVLNEGVPCMFNIHGHCHGRTEPFEGNHLNIASDVVNFVPVNLKEVIKNGWMSGVQSVHRITIDGATERSKNGLGIQKE